LRAESEPGARRWVLGERSGDPYRPIVAPAGPCVAVVTPDGRGIGLFDAVTGARVRDLVIPGAIPGRRVVLWLLASAHRPRALPPGGRPAPAAAAPPAPGRRHEPGPFRSAEARGAEGTALGQPARAAPPRRRATRDAGQAPDRLGRPPVGPEPPRAVGRAQPR